MAHFRRVVRVLRLLHRPQTPSASGIRLDRGPRDKLVAWLAAARGVRLRAPGAGYGRGMPDTPTTSTGRTLLDALVEVNGAEEPTAGQLDRMAAAYHAHPGAPRQSEYPARRPRGGGSFPR
uniref:Uncharacterized protein n=1 Tax=Corynebacterium silvaticum TaxID=2320431 RepID=A0A7U5K8X5_9CORY